MKCKKCKRGELRFWLDVKMSCPIDQPHRGGITKSAIRSKDIQIEFVDWIKARLICNNCGEIVNI